MASLSRQTFLNTKDLQSVTKLSKVISNMPVLWKEELSVVFVTMIPLQLTGMSLFATLKVSGEAEADSGEDQVLLEVWAGNSL